jgi:hypothetical protein
MERCPCCKARLGGAEHCPRCQADLGKIIKAEQAARIWLLKAIRQWQDNEAERCLYALDHSLRLKKTTPALAFRYFLIHHQCRAILELLAQRQLPAANQKLYGLRSLLPHSELLRQLHSFTDYLWVKKAPNRSSAAPILY